MAISTAVPRNGSLFVTWGKAVIVVYPCDGGGCCSDVGTGMNEVFFVGPLIRTLGVEKSRHSERAARRPIDAVKFDLHF